MKLFSLLGDSRKKAKVYISTESLLSETKLQLGNVSYLFDQLEISYENAYETEKSLALNGVNLGMNYSDLLSILGDPQASFKKALKSGVHKILFYQKNLPGFRMNIRFHLWDDCFFLGESIYEEIRNKYGFQIDRMVFEKYMDCTYDKNVFFNKLKDIEGNLLYISKSVGFRILYLSANEEVKNAVKSEIQMTKKEKENKAHTLEKKIYDSL